MLRGKTIGHRPLDLEQLKQAARIFFDPAHGVQIQGLPSGRWEICRGGDLPAITAAAERFSDDKGVYFSLNPCPANLRAPIRVSSMLRRRWLLLDVDPVRPADSNSTEDEKTAAAAVTERLYAYLREEIGWPEPVKVDSGNGYHLLYRVDLPNDDESRVLLREVLKALALRFDTGEAALDRKVHNVNRVSKLPGTWACKGAHTEERPHRLCRILAAPDIVEVVTAQQLQEVLTTDRAEREASLFSPSTGGAGHGGLTGRAVGEPDHKAAYARAALDREVLAVGRSQPGGRNNQLNESAFALGTLIGAGVLDRASVEAELLRAARGAGLGEAESRATIRSGIESGMLKPRAIPERNGHAPASPSTPPTEEWQPPIPLNVLPTAPPFPLDVFPANIRTYVEECAWATNTPPDFAAVPVLGVAAAAIGNSRWLAITRSHRQPPCLFAAVIGRPGSGKSTPFDLAMRPLDEAERAYHRQWRQELLHWRSDDGVPKPTLRRCCMDETTVEGMLRILGDNPRGLFQGRDELAALITGLNQYKEGGKGNDRQTYLKVWSAATIKVDRKNLDGIPLIVRRPLLCIVGGIQPSVIDWLRGEPSGKPGSRPAPDDGFLDRFLLSYPEELPAIGERWREVSEAAERAWRVYVQELLALQMHVLEDGDRVPVFLRLSADAKGVWSRLTEEHAAELNHEDFPDWLRGAWSKLVPGYAGRLALVLQILRWVAGEAGGDTVDGESVERSFRLVDYFKAHARKVHAAMGSDPRLPDAQRVLQWLSRHPAVKEFSRSDAYVDLRRSFRTPESLGAILELLVHHRFLRHAEMPVQGRSGGRPWTRRYEVSPFFRCTNNPNNPNNLASDCEKAS